MSEFTTGDRATMLAIEFGVRPEPWQIGYIAAAYADYDDKLDLLTTRPHLLTSQPWASGSRWRCARGPDA